MTSVIAVPVTEKSSVLHRTEGSRFVDLPAEARTKREAEIRETVAQMLNFDVQHVTPVTEAVYMENAGDDLGEE